MARRFQPSRLSSHIPSPASAIGCSMVRSPAWQYVLLNFRFQHRRCVLAPLPLLLLQFQHTAFRPFLRERPRRHQPSGCHQCQRDRKRVVQRIIRTPFQEFSCIPGKSCFQLFSPARTRLLLAGVWVASLQQYTYLRWQTFAMVRDDKTRLWSFMGQPAGVTTVEENSRKNLQYYLCQLAIACAVSVLLSGFLSIVAFRNLQTIKVVGEKVVKILACWGFEPGSNFSNLEYDGRNAQARIASFDLLRVLGRLFAGPFLIFKVSSQWLSKTSCTSMVVSRKISVVGHRVASGLRIASPLFLVQHSRGPPLPT